MFEEQSVCKWDVYLDLDIHEMDIHGQGSMYAVSYIEAFYMVDS